MKPVLSPYFKCLMFITVLLSAVSNGMAQEGRQGRHARVEVRIVPDSVADQMRNDKEFQYANDPAYWHKEKKQDNSRLLKAIEWLSRSSLLKWTLYLFLAAVILFAVYQIMVVNNFFVFGNTRKKTKASEEDTESQSPENLEMLAGEAIANKEFRLATRYLYLHVLQHLHQRQYIQLTAGATNRDYITQMQKKAGARDFRQLTRIYEYVWYGKYQPSENQFNTILHNFKRFTTSH